ncbi:hypothetical protein WAK64_16970 [Bacillus spongiae]|uniref:Uncharacterized protein n=1 Tax=Bacillus spongiae TaxID=2683610 RepID=A0ABU8HHU6_9BACI
MSTDIDALQAQIDDLQQKKLTKDLLYKRREVIRLPLLFPDYQSIIDKLRTIFIYPQGFTIDWDTREVLVVYSPYTGTDRFVVIFDLDTGDYKTYYQAGYSGGEGIVIRYINTSRYLYVKTAGNKIGKFDITVEPTKGASLTPIEEYDVNMHYNFSYRNGQWLVEQEGADIGKFARRKAFGVYNDDFELIRVITIEPSSGGLFNSDYTDYLPKRQGIALTDNSIVQGTGGPALRTNPDIPLMYQGLVEYSPAGVVVQEGLVHHTKMMDIMEQHGFDCERIENEGIHVSPDNNIYSLFVYQSRLIPESINEGIVIFEEMSSSKDAIDFSSAKTTYPAYDLTKFTDRPYPRMGDGQMYNFMTGAKLDTIDKVCKMMANTGMGEFSFYSSAVDMVDIEGTNIPNTTFVKIYNANNEAFFMEYLGNPLNQRFLIYGSPRKQLELIPSTPTAVPMGSGVSSFYPNSGLTAKKTADNLVTLRGTLYVPTILPALLGTLSTEYRPPFNLVFPIALSSSPVGGYGVVSVKTTGEIQLTYTSHIVNYATVNGISYNTD